MAKKRVSPSQKKALERARTAKRQKKGRGGEEGEEAVQQAAAATPAAPATRRRGGPAAPITGAPAARETTAAANTRARNRQTRGVQRSRRQKKERETPSVAEEEDEEEEETDEAEPSEAAGRLLRSRSLQSLSGIERVRRALQPLVEDWEEVSPDDSPIEEGQVFALAWAGAAPPAADPSALQHAALTAQGLLAGSGGGSSTEPLLVEFIIPLAGSGRGRGLRRAAGAAGGGGGADIRLLDAERLFQVLGLPTPDEQLEDEEGDEEESSEDEGSEEESSEEEGSKEEGSEQKGSDEEGSEEEEEGEEEESGEEHEEQAAAEEGDGVRAGRAGEVARAIARQLVAHLFGQQEAERCVMVAAVPAGRGGVPLSHRARVLLTWRGLRRALEGATASQLATFHHKFVSSATMWRGRTDTLHDALALCWEREAAEVS